MLEAMRRENQDLRNRLYVQSIVVIVRRLRRHRLRHPACCFRVEYERNYIQVTRMNDIYREELITLRRRVSSLATSFMNRGR